MTVPYNRTTELKKKAPPQQCELSFLIQFGDQHQYWLNKHICSISLHTHRQQGVGQITSDHARSVLLAEPSEEESTAVLPGDR